MWCTWDSGETCKGFWWEARGKKTTWKTKVEMGSKWTVERLVGGGGVEWIHLAQDRDCWQALMNAVMNPQILVPQS
jgi:hypothetical protein